MCSTGSFKNYLGSRYRVVSIARDDGREAGYQGECYLPLVFKEDLSFDYETCVELYYKQVLKSLDPADVYKEIGNYHLLDYGDGLEFSIRHIVAEWFQIFLGVRVQEIRIDELGLYELERPEYIGKFLEKVIRNDKDTRGFSSLRALYLLEKSEELEKNKITSSSYNILQVASVFRREAFTLEEEYRKKEFVKVKK